MTQRIRRPAEESRRRILEAAEQLLIDGGPDAVRVQVVARQLGVTDAAIHHHFGSRQGLLEALVRHGARELRAELEAELSRWQAGQVDFDGFARQVLDTMEGRGYARLFMWLALSGWRERGSGMFSPFVDQLHAERCREDAAADPEESRFLASLLLMALVGESLFGDTVRRSVGLDRGRSTTARFRAWMLDRMRGLAGMNVR